MSQQRFFDERRMAGEAGEAELDAYFARRYRIEPASEAEQRQEIDRWYTNPRTGHRFSVEYKTDDRAGETGNAFVETLSNVEWDVPGWAHTSAAEFLIYRVTFPETIYIIRFEALRAELPRWAKSYRHAETKNPKFTTRGVLVPLDEFERCAEFVI